MRTKSTPIFLCLIFFCFTLNGHAFKEALNPKIQRIESNLIPGPGIIIKGQPIPKASILERMQVYKIPGVSIAVIKNYKIEWAKGYGVKDTKSQESVTPDTLFQAASISKPVAAAAALHFVDKGILDLDEDVNLKLKTWKIPENEFTQNQKVTLRRLMSHTAGLTVHGFPGYAQDKERPSLVQILNGEKPANTAPIRVDMEPGTKWRYSGGGYTVMQQLLIEVLEKPFPQILKETVLEPAGMINSSYEQPLPQNFSAQAAKAYRMNGKLITGNWHIYPEMAAAGLWTTPTDLCRFALEIMSSYLGQSQKILSQNMVEDMLTVIDGNYGMGFSLRTAGGKLRFSHGGSNEGYKCILVTWLKKGEGVAIMTNGDYGSNLLTEILGSLSRVYEWPDFMPSKRTTISLSPERLKAYTGTYRFERAGDLIIKHEQGRLYAEKIFVPGEGKIRVEVFPTSETVFIATITEAHINFKKDDSGRIAGLTLVQRGRKRTASKIEPR